MKRKLLVVLFCFLSVSVFAKKIKFTDTSNQWTYYFLMKTGASTYAGSQYNDRYVGDSFINNLSYKKMYHDLVSQVVLIREDSARGKVYIISDSEEHLLYDYTLALGDTFTSPYTKHYVSNYTTMYVGGISHKLWYLRTVDTSLVYADYYVIEGIGSLCDPTFPMYPFNYAIGTSLTCFYNKGEIPPLNDKIGPFFDNTSSCTLRFSVGVSSITQEQQVAVFPNPVTGSSKIVLPEQINSGKLTIFNSIGQVVTSQPIANAAEVMIGNTVHVPGVYMYHISDNTGKVFTGRFIAQ